MVGPSTGRGGGRYQKPTQVSPFHPRMNAAPRAFIPHICVGKERILYRQSVADPCFVLHPKGFLGHVESIGGGDGTCLVRRCFMAFVMEICWIYVLYDLETPGQGWYVGFMAAWGFLSVGWIFLCCHYGKSPAAAKW